MHSSSNATLGTSNISAHTLLWASLNILSKRRYDALLERYGSLEAAWKDIDHSLLKELGCQSDTIKRVLGEKNSLDPILIAEELENLKCELITIEEKRYPLLLKNIADPPPFLFTKGDLSVLRHPTIGIVGTRAMSSYGKRCTGTVVEALIRSGCTTVSGLAVGVDAEVALRTMEYGGRTVAVLGNGINSIYPIEHTRLAQQIVENDGLLLSEFPPGVRPDRYTFPARNRIIAGLSLATVVIEAASQSGSLITASLALEYNRDVYAVPGQMFDANFEGNHHLINRGQAKLLNDPKEILHDLGIIVPDSPQENTYKAQTPEEEKLCTILTSMPQSVNDIVEKTKLPMNAINATLTLMELKGGAKNVGAGQWISI